MLCFYASLCRERSLPSSVLPDAAVLHSVQFNPSVPLLKHTNSEVLYTHKNTADTSTCVLLTTYNKHSQHSLVLNGRHGCWRQASGVKKNVCSVLCCEGFCLWMAVLCMTDQPLRSSRHIFSVLQIPYVSVQYQTVLKGCDHTSNFKNLKRFSRIKQLKS